MLSSFSLLTAKIGDDYIRVTGFADMEKAVNFCLMLRKKYPNRRIITNIS